MFWVVGGPKQRSLRQGIYYIVCNYAVSLQQWLQFAKTTEASFAVQMLIGFLVRWVLTESLALTKYHNQNRHCLYSSPRLSGCRTHPTPCDPYYNPCMEK